jgi:iron(III) transport system ATP-binding protein
MSLDIAVSTQNLSKQFGDDQPAVYNLDLAVRTGEILALLGPSGCGKTTTLRLLAGFERPDEGSIQIQGKTVADKGRFVPPEKRGIGMVFQEYALFPHLNVFDNVAFGLGGRRSKAQRIDTATSMLKLVGLEALAGRFPYELSGGQRQRIALARALAPRPFLILLDEPFSNLDADLRTLMREEVRVILKGIQATAVFVTHDQEEAMYMGDRIAVMNAGQLEQIGPAETLFHDPQTRFVADFMGSTDFLPGTVTSDGIETEIGLIAQSVEAAEGSAVELAVRPDDVRFEPEAGGKSLVLARHFRGAMNLYRLRLPSGRLLHAMEGHMHTIRPGNPARVWLEPGHNLAVFMDGKRVKNLSG